MDDVRRVEALLFASGSYLSEEKIAQMTGVSLKNVKKAIKKLIEQYSKLDTSLKIFEEEGSYKMNLKENFSDIVQAVVSEAELPRPVMETLAMIAYKSPVLQSQITNARGSSAYDHIKILEEKNFISRERFERTFKIKVTDKFSDYFDVKDSKDIAELFKDIKKPDPEKLGPLDVYDSDENHEIFAKKISDRMKTVEVTPQDKENESEFLDKFDEKMGVLTERIDEAEKEIDELKPQSVNSEEGIEEVEQSREIPKDTKENLIINQIDSEPEEETAKNGEQLDDKTEQQSAEKHNTDDEEPEEEIVVEEKNIEDDELEVSKQEAEPQNTKEQPTNSDPNFLKKINDKIDNIVEESEKDSDEESEN